MVKLLIGICSAACLLIAGCSKHEATDKIVRIGTLGDSITEGSAEANYPRELDSLLPDNYIVTNYGKGGTCLVKNCFNPIWKQESFARLLTDQPDIIIIMLGTNDFNPTNSDTVRANYEKDYRTMIGLFREFPSKPRILLCYPPPIHAHWDFIDSLIRTEAIPIINRIAKDLKAEVVDTYYKVDDYPEHYPDGLHPNLEGHKTLAGIVRDALKL